MPALSQTDEAATVARAPRGWRRLPSLEAWRWAGTAAGLASPLLLALIALSMGLYQVSPWDVARSLASLLHPEVAADVPEIARRLVLDVRLPRVLAALLIGAGLAVTGVVFQGIFTNPLVDSNLLGVTSGAGFGAALVLLLGGSAWAVQASAFAFGLLAVSLAFLGSRLYRSAPKIVLTLMGILIGSFFASLTSLLKYVADPLDALPSITFWLLGGLTGVGWRHVPLLAALTAAGAVLFLLVRWRLNVLSLGDAEASALGMRPERMKLILIIAATLVTAIAVSVGGVIGWVGLVVPHAARIVVGPDHRRLVPMSLALGASFLLIIDTVSRALLPSEVPLGVLTGLIGVPILVLLLRRTRTGW
ncbi:MAG: iron ABC transporter permease [Trueperaceae bacterium]|nr:iron ABC transporter permease [Trueperaceae bacterium]